MSPNDSAYRGFLQQQVGVPPALVGTYADIQSLIVKAFERTHLLGVPFPVEGWTKPTPGQWAADRFLQSSPYEGKTMFLSFPMIGRLAEPLLRVNPMARDAAQTLASPNRHRVSFNAGSILLDALRPQSRAHKP